MSDQSLWNLAKGPDMAERPNMYGLKSDMSGECL
jgi:hypothetical protein